ncbi:DNA adenine methylase [Leptolyngbya cf. ectocarpi LEGE 11479]|uniref:DNA adenine methylase n=1 Tax=Leptolyngbya cf. ectocarpi LEGE 11479 TaxID=1828722 RepID=A0A928ZUV5_LEPEC|nr:DNA adenine methylase [Leptolyngbya ectocarpi]MBE9067902.1 DNA adenine methylase [Leptolyngbya cf. ectocarpi LEGE 11479]
MLVGTQLSALPDVPPYEISNPCSGGNIQRPALRYFGGKWRIAPWIINHLPEHRVYCEPYGGAFSVGLRKSPAAVEILNERNPNVVNFFQMLKAWPRELITALDVSPRTQAEFEKCKVIEGDTLEQARRFYLQCQMSFSNGGGRWSSGTSTARLRLVEDQNCDYLLAVSRRLANVQIEHGLAETAIAIHDSAHTLFYVDPPYVQSVRGSKDSRHINGAPRRQYAYEMIDDDHRQLAAILRHCYGMVVLSGYRSDLYDELYPDWQRIERKVRTSSRGQRVECLWIKPACDLIRVGGQQTAPPKPRTHRPKGSASGWLETRTGNKKRKNPTVSYYYRWDSPRGRVSEYVKAGRVTRVHQLITDGKPALEILKVVVEGKKKLSGVSAELLGQ